MKNKQVICLFSLFLLFTLVFLLACTDSSNKTDSPQIRVSKTTKVRVEAPDMKVVGDEQETYYQIKFFDRQGYRIARFDYDSFDKYDYEYDDNENIKKVTNRRTDGVSTWDDLEYQFIYDDNGNIAQTLSRFWRLPDGTTIIYEYDSDGSMKERSSYYGGKELTNKTIFHYDENGRMIEEVGIGSSGSPTTKDVHEYDVNGNLTKIAFYDLRANNRLLWETIEFDENGDVKENVRYAYDYQNNPILNYTITVDYLEFDQYGNWTKSVQTRIDEFGTKKYLQTRDIEYYDVMP